MKTIAVIGGTGALGLGLAARLSGKYKVVIGSREKSRAEGAASRVTRVSGSRVFGAENAAAAHESDVSILAIPDLPSDALLLGLKPELSGKLVISPIVPMTVREGLFAPALDSGSAAERVASALSTRVAGAFHTVPAARLFRTTLKLDYDVPVTADSREVYEEAAAIVSNIAGLRPLYAGPLAASRIVEELTPLLLNLGKLNGMPHPSIRVV